MEEEKRIDQEGSVNVPEPQQETSEQEAPQQEVSQQEAPQQQVSQQEAPQQEAPQQEAQESVGGNDLGTTSMGMQPTVAALLSYLLGFITGIIFFVIEKDNKYVRFHALQSILVFGAFFALNMILPFIPIIGWILLPFVGIASVVIWIILMVKGMQGEYFKLPIAGDIAEKNS